MKHSGVFKFGKSERKIDSENIADTCKEFTNELRDMSRILKCKLDKEMDNYEDYMSAEDIGLIKGYTVLLDRAIDHYDYLVEVEAEKFKRIDEIDAKLDLIYSKLQKTDEK